MLQDKPVALLCDFGTAGIMKDATFEQLDAEEDWQGSYRWCSPEIFSSGTRTLGSDVWSWGWLVWEVRATYDIRGGRPPDGLPGHRL